MEWKISRFRTESSREEETTGRVNLSFQTGRVEPQSSGLVASLRSGSSQKTA